MRFQAKLIQIIALGIVTTLLAPTQSRAQTAADNDASDRNADSGPQNLMDDIKEYATAPLHWKSENWLYFGGTLVAIGAAHHYDDQVRTHFTAAASTTTNNVDTHDRKDAMPAAAAVAGTWLYATLINDADGRSETWSMLEAAALSSTTGLILKYAAGRERPNQTADDNRWREGADSFPSLHVTAAFAIGTVLAESGNDRYRWIRRFLGYGIATATGYERLKHNAHWLSDTVAGAALGMASAHFVMNRANSSSRDSAVMWVPLDRGVMLTYSAVLH